MLSQDRILDLYASFFPKEQHPLQAINFARAIEAEAKGPQAGWAVVDPTGVIFVSIHRELAEVWLQRGIPGREVRPIFL